MGLKVLKGKMVELKEIILQNPPSLLSEGEQHVIQEVFSNAAVRKYLNTLLWNSIRDLASIPIPEIVTEKYRIQHAYVKGNIGILNTLLMIKEDDANQQVKE